MNTLTQIEFKPAQSFGDYQPTSSMRVNDNVSIRVNNFSSVKQSVKLFYTGSGENSLKNFNNDWNKNIKQLTTDEWGGSFLNSGGGVWVNDGSTLPYAFNSIVELRVLYSYGAGTLVTLQTQVGELIDSFLLRFTNAIYADIGNYNLADMSTCGSHIYYSNNNCYIDFIQYNLKLGGSAPQQIYIFGYSAPSLLTDIDVFTFNLKNPLPTNWNVPIEVNDLSSIDTDGYRSFVASLLNQDLFINNLRKFSNNSAQISEEISFISYDLDGESQTLSQTKVIDPYQAQIVIDGNADILLDGQTYAQFKMLAGEFLELTLSYDKVGIYDYEKIASLDENSDSKIINAEEFELEESYSNFSGFKTNKQTEKLLLLAIAILIIYKK